MANFKVGDEVVCINDESPVAINGEKLTLDKIYEVSENGFLPETDFRIAFHYIKVKGQQTYWLESRFAPVQTQYTSCHGSSEIAKKFVEVKEGVERIGKPEKVKA